MGNNLTSIVAAVFASGGIYTLIQFLVTRYDNKRNMGKLLNEKIEALVSQFEEYRAIQARVHILRFSDDLKNNMYHSQEFFRQLLADIDTYNQYCDKHKNFRNGMTVMASQNIQEEYKKRFLKGEENNEQ